TTAPGPRRIRAAKSTGRPRPSTNRRVGSPTRRFFVLHCQGQRMLQLVLFNLTNGLIVGAFYVLMALGLSLIINLSNVVNFAHGGFLVIGGYIAYTITPYIGFWGALLLAPPLTAIIGLAVERVLIRPLYGRDPF